MLHAALEGFLLGAGLIVAIGAQNAFVLRQGLKRQYVIAICLVCASSDALLIAIGVAGLGTALGQSPKLILAVSLGGAAFLIGYGLRAFLRALRTSAMQAGEGQWSSLAGALAAALAFTFLNPHVYLDTVLLLGSLSARHAGAARIAYGAGAVLASYIWFFGLGYGARLLQPVFASPRAWRILDLAIALVMWTIAAGLLAGLST